MNENEISNMNHTLLISNFKFNPISQALAASFFMLLSGTSSADCLFTGADVICNTDSPNPYTTAINLSNTDNANIIIDNNSSLEVGNNISAITAGTNATLTFKSGSYTHNTNGSNISDMLNLRSGSHVIVEENAMLNSGGFNSQSETIQLAGGDSSVDNKGTILSQGAFAINLQGDKDNIINNSGIIHGYRGGIWNASSTEIIITNSGTIQGDTGVAIDLNSQHLGESAILILEEGSTIIGNVVSNSTAINTLVLGGNAISGSGGDSFSVDLIGNNSQYQEFSFFKKQGTSNWTLEGIASQDINWEIDDGTLTFGSSTQGNGTLTVNSTGNLDLAFNNATFANNVAGAGKVTVSGTGVELGSDAMSFTGVWDVTGSASATQQSQLGNAQVQLNGAQSLLTLANFEETFSSQLTGNGTLQIHQNNDTTPFSFASTTGSAFTGTVEMQQGILTLDANAEYTLANSTLSLAPDSTAALSTDRTIHNFVMGGGALQMDNSRTEAHTLTTNAFDASGYGSIKANIPKELSPPVIPANPSYFDQDVVRNVQVVKATGDVTGIGNHLDLYNFDGSMLVGTSQEVDITEGDVKFGTATYDQAAVVTEDGAWVGFDLVKLDASAGQTLVLENEPGMDNMLVAKLTGEGNFDIQGSGTVILNNHNNDYTGDTLISGGNVQLGSDNALGQTRDVSIASGTGLDISGKTQAITTLHGAAGSNLNLNDGTLTLTQGGESSGTLEGSGQLNLEGGVLTIDGPNRNFSASTNIALPATATLNDIQGLGNGAINVDGNLNLSGVNGTMSNLLSGNGTVALEDGALVTLNNTVRTFAGDFTVATGTQLTAQEAGSLGSATITNNGTLELNNNADWTLTNAVSGSGGMNKTGTGTLFAGQNMIYTGDTHITEGALQVNGNFGSTGTMYVEQTGTLKGNGSIAGPVINSGIIDLTSDTQNNALTINGDYSSNHGQLWVNTELSGDNSAHDELFVKGSTRGNTNVTVKNMHGLGAQTVNGIELVNVQGQSDGTFALQGRAVAGAYEYKLYQGTSAENDGNWYLRSATDAPTPPDPTPPDPTPPAPNSPVLRPEAGVYLANQSLANSVFVSTMHDRNAENRQTGEDSPATWAHLDAGRVNSKAGGDQLSMGSNTTVLRIGSDIYRHDFGNQQIKAGLMTGYAHVDTDSNAKHVSDSAKGTLEGYNFGVYGTWFGGSADQKSGPYADTWMQYGTFHNTVKGDDLAEEKYHAHNWAGSLELGYRMLVSDVHVLYLQPQFQTIYSNYSQGDHTEDNGTRIHSQDAGGVTTRLGARLSGQLDDAGKAEPFVELNWWHGGSSNSVKMDTETVNQSVPVNRYEAKLGAQLKTGENWMLWINSGVQAGENHYSSVQGQIGGRYSW